MSTTFVYTVQSRDLGPLILRGTSSDPSFKLTALTVLPPVAPPTKPDRTIKKANTADRINAIDSAEFDKLRDTARPYSIAFTGDEQSNGDFIISSLVVNTSVAPPAMPSAPAKTGT